jgi:hypothetical protein
MSGYSRRLFLGHLFAAFAAPAIVHAGNLMPIRALDPILVSQYPWWNGTAWMGQVDDVGLTAITRQAFLPRLQAQLYEESETFVLRMNEQLYR